MSVVENPQRRRVVHTALIAGGLAATGTLLSVRALAADKAAVSMQLGWVPGGNQVGEVGPGDCVGEMALLDGGSRGATVKAKTPMETYVLSAREFRSLVQVNPTIIYKIAAALARRLRAAESDQPH